MTDKVEWESSNEGVVSVKAGQVIAGRRFGISKVSAFLKVGDKVVSSEICKVLVSTHKKILVVPQLIGKSQEQALEILGEEFKLSVKSVLSHNKNFGAGEIILQFPFPGTKIEEGSTIIVKLNPSISP